MNQNIQTRQGEDGLFGMASGQHSDLFSILELFPMPLEVFSADGISRFVNQAFVDTLHISAEQLVGKFNVLEDPYLNRALGLTENLRQVFAGEAFSFCDLKVPFEEIGRRYNCAKARPVTDDLYQEVICFPLWGSDQSVAGVAAMFMTKQICQARQDAVRAREYIDAHWPDDFDLDKIAAAAGVSRYHLTRLFKKYIGKTPYSYYQEVKLEKIKEALRDPGLSVGEAFAACGADYSGCFAEAFKRAFKMTPTQYRHILKSSGSAGLQNPGAKPGELHEQKTPHLPIPRFTSENIELLYQVLEYFPLPIKVFTPDGYVAFANRVILEMWNISEPSQIVGRYNLLRDSVTNDRLGLRDYVQRTFRGEIVLVPEVKVPLEAFAVWYKARDLGYDIESMYTDILNFPVQNSDGQITHIVSVFLTTRVYQGQTDIARAREYLENHWKEEFDADAIARAVNLSPSHLARLFKKYTGITLYSYYQDIKIKQLKTALKDQTLSVAEAFLSCGFDYMDNWTMLFKKKVGMTPTQYRKSVKKR